MNVDHIKEIIPISHGLAKAVSVPGSKSHTNRGLIVAALSTGSTVLKNALFSDDCHYLAAALLDLGFEVKSNPLEKNITVHGLKGRIPVSRADLFIGNAGTAARFLTAMLTLGHGRYSLDGVERMRQRPIGDLVAALNNLGAHVNGSPPKYRDLANFQHSGSSMQGSLPLYPPVTLLANGLSGGTTTIQGEISSQFLSALLMVAPKAQSPVQINVTGHLNSLPYIDLTLGVMADFGVEVQRQEYKSFSLDPQNYSTPGEYWIESDASSASYFFAASAICGGWVEVANISHTSRQGDIAFVDVLARMGCSVSQSGNGIRVTGPPQLNGIDVNMGDISDTAMTLAAIAPFADTPTTIHGIASSRFKETDRIKAACNELRRLGIRVDEHPDGMTIFPCDKIQPASIQTYDDHRVAMAFSLIGLRVPGIHIENPTCVAKTFPNFFEVLDQIR